MNTIESTVEPVIPERRPELWAVIFYSDGCWHLSMPRIKRGDVERDQMYINEGHHISIVHIPADPGSGEKK